MKHSLKDKAMFISSMAIFGTIGLFRKFIPLPSSLIALVRGFIGTIFLILIVSIQKKKLDSSAIRNNFFPLMFSGTAIGFNWILLFEAFNYTSIATATLCYYLSPVLVILGAHIFLKEKITLRQAVCAGAALMGMIPVSGVLEAGISNFAEMKGILFGIGAAFLYASVILTNKRMSNISAYDKTILQLFFASFALLPYVLLTVSFKGNMINSPAVCMLATVGILHTGLAYWLYFASIGSLKPHTIALWSYLDPVLAIILSTLILREPMRPSAWIGAAVILGSAYISEK